MFLSFFFLDAPAEPQGQGGGYQMLIMIGLVIAVFYFFMIRPQQRKQKQEQKMRDSLGKGDRVVTIGGIHGRIVSVDETTALIEVDNGVKLKMEKAALKPAGAELEDKPKK